MDTAILLMIVIFMFGAFLKGWSGFGTNLVVPPLFLFLTRFDSLKEVMVIVISVNLFLNILMIVRSKQFNLNLLREIWILIVVAVSFHFIGTYFKGLLDDSMFRIFLGVAIILVTLNRIFKLRFSIKELQWYHYLVTGIFSGILNGLFGLGGIPLLILLGSTKIEKFKMRSTLVSYFFIMNIIFIVGEVVNNSYNSFVIQNILILIGFALVACMAGLYFSSRVNDKVFQRVMNGILIFFGINLIYHGIFGAHIFTLFS